MSRFNYVEIQFLLCTLRLFVICNTYSKPICTILNIARETKVHTVESRKFQVFGTRVSKFGEIDINYIITTKNDDCHFFLSTLGFQVYSMRRFS